MRYLASIFVFLLSVNLSAQSSNAMARYVEGVDYKVLSPMVRTVTKDKIEVTEAFSYVCGHCYNFETVLKKWKKDLPTDVGFVKLPVVFQASMEHYARIMYTADALGVSEQVSDATFKAIHLARNRLRTDKQVSAIFEAQGVSAEDFKKTFKSFGINSKIKQAKARTRALKITGTPQMFVGGRYSVEVTKETGHSGMLKVVDFLVAKIRAEKK